MILLLDVAASLAFLVALGVNLAIPVRRGGLVSRGVKTLISLSVLVYALVSISNALEHGGLGHTAVDDVEDYLEVLFMPLLAYCAYAFRSRYFYVEQVRAARRARRQHDFLLQILDMSPVGLVVVDDIGRVTFASEGARRALALEEGASVTLSHPDWEILGPSGAKLERGFASLCPEGRTAEDVPLVLAWPDGTSTSLLVSAAPMADRTGRLGGYVIALEDVSARRAVLGA